MSILMRHRAVSDVMTSHVHVAAPLTPFKILVRIIEENRVSAIPIVDQQGIPIGIVSEGDLVVRKPESSGDLLDGKKRRNEKAKTEGTVASDVMTSPPITVAAGATLREAARVMRQKNVGRLVVLDVRGRIAGIVSRSDLLEVSSTARAGSARSGR